MKLARYLKENQLTPEQLAVLVGGVSVSGIRKWIAGERVPRPEQMRRIASVTNRAVLPNDFIFVDEAAE